MANSMGIIMAGSMVIRLASCMVIGMVLSVVQPGSSVHDVVASSMFSSTVTSMVSCMVAVYSSYGAEYI